MPNMSLFEFTAWVAMNRAQFQAIDTLFINEQNVVFYECPDLTIDYHWHQFDLEKGEWS